MTAHTPTPLTFRLHKNGRDFEIVCAALRPEWVGTELGQNQVIATLSIGDYTDETGAARALNEANAAFIVRACNSHDALVAERDRLQAMCADLCYAVTRDPLLGQRLDIDLAATVRSVAHQAMQGLLAAASDDATKLEAKNDALVAALEEVRAQANRVYAMGDAEARRALCAIFGTAVDALKSSRGAA